MNSSYHDQVAGFGFRDTPAGPMLESGLLSRYADHGITTRHLVFQGPEVARDYDLVARRFGLREDKLVRVRQVHGRAVLVIPPGHVHSTLTDADAIVSTNPDLAASVRVADCVPIFLADERGEAVAVVHAGWRGTAAGIAAETVRAIRRLGIQPGRLVAAIGPSIGPCCYQVSSDVRAEMSREWPNADGWFASDEADRWKLNLWRANQEQLESEGVRAGAIQIAGMCTADDLGTWFSYRKEGSGIGRMLAAIRLRRKAPDRSS